MKNTLVIFTLLSGTCLTSALNAQHALVLQSGGSQSELFEQEDAAKVNSQEEKLYATATNDLNNGNYTKAQNGFDQVAKLKGRRAAGALYWKAYALNKGGQREEALARIAELKGAYPQSRWLQEAGALEIEIRSNMGQPQDPGTQPDEELVLIAINSLMQSDPERALPILEKLLKGKGSLKVKDRALFVLSQSDSEQAHKILANIAKGQEQPDLQSKAIHYLGINGNSRNRQALQDVYLSSGDPGIKKTVLRALMITGDKERVYTIATQEKNVELQKEAIRQLGVMGARSELRQLYKGSPTSEAKQELLHAMAIGGDVSGLIDVAKTEADGTIRVEAIHGLGITGGRESEEALVSIYSSNADVETKKQVIHSLFIHAAAKGLVDLARKETNPELKKELVREISIMGSKEGTEYMLEILNK